MADNALKAKQRAAEQLQRQVEVLQQRGASDKLLQRVGVAHNSFACMCMAC